MGGVSKIGRCRRCKRVVIRRKRTRMCYDCDDTGVRPLSEMKEMVAQLHSRGLHDLEIADAINRSVYRVWEIRREMGLSANRKYVRQHQLLAEIGSRKHQ